MAEVGGLETKQTCRYYIEKCFNSSKYGRALENFNTIITFIGCFMYVCMTYSRGKPEEFYKLDPFVGAVYLVEWILKLYVAQHRVQYFFTINSLLDFITAIPLFFNNPRHIYVQLVRIIRIIRVVRMVNKFAASQGSTEVSR